MSTFHNSFLHGASAGFWSVPCVRLSHTNPVDFNFHVRLVREDRVLVLMRRGVTSNTKNRGQRKKVRKCKPNRELGQQYSSGIEAGCDRGKRFLATKSAFKSKQWRDRESNMKFDRNTKSSELTFTNLCRLHFKHCSIGLTISSSQELCDKISSRKPTISLYSFLEYRSRVFWYRLKTWQSSFENRMTKEPEKNFPVVAGILSRNNVREEINRDRR